MSLTSDLSFVEYVEEFITFKFEGYAKDVSRGELGHPIVEVRSRHANQTRVHESRERVPGMDEDNKEYLK